MAKKKPAKKAAAKTAAKSSKTSKKAAPKKSAAKKAVKSKPAATSKTTRKAAAPVKKVARPAAKKSDKPAASKAKQTATKDEGRKLAESVVSGMLEKKAQNIKWLDLRKIENAVCDYFIICEGGSNTQVEAIADSVEETVKKQTGQRPYRSEGWENALWILIDYVNVVVHVFERETRYFYNLESLWADAEEIPVKQ